MKVYAVRFSVVADSITCGEFPIDMLRYDGCYPADQESVGEIADALHAETRHLRHCEKQDREKQDPNKPKLPLFRIRLTALAINKNWRPTGARWASFGWQIEPGSIRLDPL